LRKGKVIRVLGIKGRCGEFPARWVGENEDSFEPQGGCPPFIAFIIKIIFRCFLF
jgi:hypothetical protein